MTFSENLLFFRERTGLTQEQLAERLEVSRQSVSKWESGSSYPEMEKLLQLCDLFHTDLDTLLRRDARACYVEDNAGYDRLMDWFSKMIAGGVGLILLGLSVMCFLVGLGLNEDVSAATLLSFIVVAVVLFIVAGIRYDGFEEKHPYIEPFYSPAELETFAHRFPLLVALPVAAIMIGVIWIVLFGEQAEAAGIQAEGRLEGVFFLILAVAISVLVWAGLQKSKYDLDAWNREHDQSPEAVAKRKKIGFICGVIMLSVTVIYLAVGFGFMAFSNNPGNSLGWEWGWIGYPVGGVICAIAATVIKRGE